MLKSIFDLDHCLVTTFERVGLGTLKRPTSRVSPPLVEPLPPEDRRPLEGRDLTPPFIYWVSDSAKTPTYIGSSLESNLLLTWTRKDTALDRYLWSYHPINKIAEGITQGRGPYALHFTTTEKTLRSYPEVFNHLPTVDPTDIYLAQKTEDIKDTLRNLFKPEWNRQKG